MLEAFLTNLCVITCDSMFVMNLEPVQDWQLLTRSPEIDSLLIASNF